MEVEYDRVLEGDEGTSSDHAKSSMVKSLESLQYQRMFYCITDDKYYSTVTMSQNKEKITLSHCC